MSSENGAFNVGAEDTANLLCARGLCKRFLRRSGIFFSGGGVQALDGVDMDIRMGSTLALVGESGSGKSTLAHCLARLEEPDSGEIWFRGEEITFLAGDPLMRLRREVQLVFQDPAAALNPRFSAAEIVEEPLEVQGIGNKSERRRRALELMERVGLSSSSCGKLPMEFSGGQRQRLAIARALALEPKLLILDESLSSLDLSVRAQLVNLLLDLQASCSLTYLFISHDLGLAAHVADEIAVMQRGRIVERATVDEFFNNARHPHSRLLLESIPSM